MPRGAAHAWAALGHLREAELRLEEQARTTPQGALQACVEDHLRPVTGGIYDSRCRRLGSPQSSREVPAETQRSPPEPAGGRGHSGRIGVRGVQRPRGGRREPGPIWPLEVRLRDAVAHRLRPVGISAQARSVTVRAGLAFRVPGTRIRRAPRTSTRRAPCLRQGKARCARPFRTLDGGAVVRSGASRPGRAAGWQPGCATSLCRDVFGRGQACSYEPGLQAGDGAVL